jgi:hypothetical protein
MVAKKRQKKNSSQILVPLKTDTKKADQRIAPQTAPRSIDGADAHRGFCLFCFIFVIQ